MTDLTEDAIEKKLISLLEGQDTQHSYVLFFTHVDDGQRKYNMEICI